VNILPAVAGFSLGVLSDTFMTSYCLTINYNQDKVCQQEYLSALSKEDFLLLMAQEWMINPDNGDELTLEILEPVS